MVAIEHRQKPTANTTTVITTTTTTSVSSQQQDVQQQQQEEANIIELPQLQQQLQQHISQQSALATRTALVRHTNKMSKNELESAELTRKHQEAAAAAIAKSAVSQRGVEIKLASKSNVDAASQELTKKVLKLDLTGQDLDEFSLKSPKSPISARLPHQTSLTSSVDVEDRKTLREALYQGIFHRHRRTIFAVGSFLRMLRSRNSQYNTIRSSSEGEDTEEIR